VSTVGAEVVEWSVILVSEADQELGEVPPQVRKKFDFLGGQCSAFRSMTIKA
jgi:hypothetical protein